MTQNLEKLKALLAELFQLDQADLDFGIYRIMNTKREEITRFLDRDLLPQVREAFQAYQAGNRGAVEAELAEAIEKAKELGADPETLPRVKELRVKLAQAVDVTALENEVYSHLYNFFRRYYSEGDFISLRRYKEGVYAIPYEGEEVKLYWANHDQYYIKTSEYLRNYTFKLPSGKRVHFKLVEADTEKDNNRPVGGNERRFVYKELTVEGAEEIVLRFEYKPIDEKKKQADLNAQAIERIKKDLETLRSSASSAVNELFRLAPTEKNPNRTLLEKHLTDYTARNTFDYFIHKDLGGFLRRELDFYIKNEVMHLDDIENETAPRVEQYLSKIKAIRRIAHKIIDFLAQIENFQKRLWLKKKFVVETQYCVTLDRVPEALYPEIAANDAQREEWVRLGFLNAEGAEGRRVENDLFSPRSSASSAVEFLKANPYLVLDTRHFSDDFKRRLLASFDDLDEQCDGLLIHSENFQALNLLTEEYKGRVKCIYIDPPYNTGEDGFPYKDSYRHSSWTSMVRDRIALSRALLAGDSSLWCSLDDNELGQMLHLMSREFGESNFIATVVWQKRTSPDARYPIGAAHDYISVYARDAFEFKKTKRLIPLSKDRMGNYSNPDNDPRGPWASVDLTGQTGHATQSQFYEITTPSGRRYGPPEGRCWALAEETFNRLVAEGRIWFGVKGDSRPRLKRFLSEVEGTTSWTWWSNEDVGHNQEATKELNNLFGSGGIFETVKPVRLLERIIQLGARLPTDVVLDYFAGSGTTAHAIINLNREDGGRRKYILVEMGEYFDTVLVPRIKKVVYSKDWKDGKPVSREGISHMFKYLRLESYEDTLNNLELKRTEAQQRLLEEHPAFREDYMLHYMLDVESRGSASLLNLDRFEDPFSYKLNIATGTVGETKPTVVDLVETFNYLIGLRVKTIDHIGGMRVVTGLNPQGERVLILWRKTKELDNDALDAWFRKQGYNTRDQEFDVIYVNGDNNLENLKKPDQTWKVRLIEEEFLRRMFDVQDV